MNAEWADMCAVFYGGNFASGGYFVGLKPMLVSANMGVANLYALSGNWPAAATVETVHAYQTGGSESGPEKHSSGSRLLGGIRELTEVVYNNQATNLPADGGYYSEFWGPAAAWAAYPTRCPRKAGSFCKPTNSTDHRWNDNATRVVIPILTKDHMEGHQWTTTIRRASIRPMTPVFCSTKPYPLGRLRHFCARLHARLAQCPVGSGLNTRSCSGATARTTSAEGQMYQFPTTAGSSSNSR